MLTSKQMLEMIMRTHEQMRLHARSEPPHEEWRVNDDEILVCTCGGEILPKELTALRTKMRHLSQLEMRALMSGIEFVGALALMEEIE